MDKGGKEENAFHWIIQNGYVFHEGQGWAQAPKPVIFTNQPYLLRLSLKRLEVVGDILQLLLQLRTLTVNILNTAGEERGKRKK